MITVPPGKTVRPDHLAQLETYLADRGGDWRVFTAHPDTAIYTLMQDVGDAFVVCTVQLDTEPLFDMNRELEINSQGKRFGDGQRMASVPLHLAYTKEGGYIMQRLDDGDRKGVRKFLNDSENYKFRTFRGKL